MISLNSAKLVQIINILLEGPQHFVFVVFASFVLRILEDIFFFSPHVFCASANHLGALGHPSHAACAGRCCDGAAGLRSPAAQRSATDLESVYTVS